jgi:hypothetical protein
MIIVGLCGAIGSGKTTVAEHLVETYNFDPIKFAGPLKDMMRALGLTEEEINGRLKEQPCDLLGGKTPRWAQQSIGTEWGRNLIDPDLWTRAWKKRALDSLYPVVADDVRFANEAKLIRELGGTIIHIDRPGIVISSHVSEAMPFTPDVVIKNDKGVVDLLQEINWLALNIWHLKAAA